MWKLNNMLLNSQRVNEEIKEKINTWRQIKRKHKGPKALGCSKSSSKREIYSDKGLSQETRKISINLTLYLKILEQEEQRPKLVEGRK